MITAGDMPEGYRLVVASAQEVEVRDAMDPELRVKAMLEDSGELWFWIRAERESDGTRGIVRGGVLYDLMMRHFGGAVSSVIGWWTEGTNHEDFRKGIGQGMKPSVAASKTWSGRQALRHGFRVVSVHEECDHDNLVGIKVVFKRTEASE
jgi:hypothetical protein